MFQSESTLFGCLLAALLEADTISEVYMTAMGLEPTLTKFVNEHSTIYLTKFND